ncbi:hypothetical protein ACHAXA_002717 [Cyclostephanos tholiformis]|uniref:EF-hand domain-containing protein n=1 Tax=Cyclostephanos tholiformis TaxID=382380 RepID=A0ABD3R544_9STRA
MTGDRGSEGDGGEQRLAREQRVNCPQGTKKTYHNDGGSGIGSGTAGCLTRTEGSDGVEVVVDDGGWWRGGVAMGPFSSLTLRMATHLPSSPVLVRLSTSSHKTLALTLRMCGRRGQIPMLRVTFMSREEQHTSAVRGDDIVIDQSPTRTSRGFGSVPPPPPPSAFLAMRGGGGNNIGSGYGGGGGGYGGRAVSRGFGSNHHGNGGRGHILGGGGGGGGGTATMAAAVGGRNGGGGIRSSGGGRGNGGGGNQRKSTPPLGPTNEIGFPVVTGAGKRRAVTVEQMSLENADGDESDTLEDINETQYAGKGKGSDGDDYDDLRPLPSTVAISSPACLSRSTVPLSLYSTRANPSLLSTTVHVPRTYTGALPGDCQYLARQFHASPCASSDNLLGYSPMSRPPVPTTSQQASVLPSSKSGPTWGTDANTAGGGVWAQTSAKREKLAELLTELNSTGVDTATRGMETLDVAADPQEKLDLELADGLKMIARFVDDGMTMSESINGQNSVAVLKEESTKAVENLLKLLESFSAAENGIEKAKFEATMHEAIRILSAGLPPEPNLKKPVAGSLDASNPLCYLRQFVELSEENIGNQECDNREVDEQIHQLNAIAFKAFSSSTQIYRTLLLRATAQTLLENWDTLTTVTSGDIDRAAVSKSALSSHRTVVNAKNIQKLFVAYANGSCKDWVQSWWNLIDDDGDGLIDEEEMTNLPAALNSKKSLSWRDRRRELKARKAFTNTLQTTLKRHFRDQVEAPHRLRCIYAWADKSHQNNKLDSIVVDSSDDWGAASSIMGRKRFVELLPKISYPEFRNVQARHFPHLDKIGEEIAMSFKEDLWVLQGKRRQNKELRRDSFLFLFGISLVDFGIGML